MTEPERREFLKAAGASLAGVVGMGILSTASCSRQGGTIQNPTREELAKRLEKLAASKPPGDLSLGACCYDMIYIAPNEMPCPKCEQTMIVGEKDEILREYNVPLKRIQDQGVDAKLIIPEHCPECGLGLKEANFQLEIKYPDHPVPIRVELETARDLELMALFLQGKDRYTCIDDRETALKNEVDRLKELFGVAEVK